MTRMPSPTWSRVAVPDVARRMALLGLGVTVAAQFFVLYVPQPPTTPMFPYADKVIHASIFAAPVVLALLAGLPARAAVTVIAAHAPVSEMIQHIFLPERSGDFFDVLADLAGVTLGVVAFRGLGLLVARRQASRSTSPR